MDTDNISLFPTVVRVLAKTISQDLIDVIPMGYDGAAMKKINEEVRIMNRDIRVDNILNDTDNKEMSVSDHPDFKKADKNAPGNLFYMDYTYNK